MAERGLPPLLERHSAESALAIGLTTASASRIARCSALHQPLEAGRDEGTEARLESSDVGGLTEALREDIEAAGLGE